MKTRNPFSTVQVLAVLALLALTAGAIMISAAGESSLMIFALLGALALIPLYLVIPMFLAGQQEGWDQLDDPAQEDGKQG